MQFELVPKETPFPNISQKTLDDYSNYHQAGLAVVKEYKSSFVLEPYPSFDQTQLDVLIHCQKCHSKFKQPTTLSCGFTLCSGCLPSSEPYQCPSFTCLRTHYNDDYKPNVLLENILIHYEQNQYEAIKSLLDCSICLSPLTQPITTQCGHTFCKDCLIHTMTDVSHKACPFCRQPLNRIGKINEIISGWLDYVYHDGPSKQTSLDPSMPVQHTPILQVTQKITFPFQHCIIHITKDPKGLLRQIEARPYQKHHIICVFSKPDSASIYDHAMMLRINHMEYSPDNRHFVIQAVGVFRLRLDQFRLQEDDCYVGNIYRLDDDNDDLDTLLTSCHPAQTIHPIDKLPKKPSSRPRPYSMRLSSSAPSTHLTRFSINRNTPGSMPRRVWAAGFHSSPVQYDDLQVKMMPDFMKTKINSLLTEHELFEQELHPRILQFLNTMSDGARSMQYDWYLQQPQSDHAALVWWIANTVPLPQEQKIHVLSLQSLKERILALISLLDHLLR
ncbi:LON peptidase N-terminal domain and RING finger protein 1 [Choanephora cucurbitarum]|uniref:LON peptidase N-terminal domain and RING finger protein 1 n=1 Tax=Choanephora cucurbitarum TaxID=101091 RepID=A0A1C7NAJ2_9FUNG|nr:LON peptidase N-terminal domain and RING finger protein 1 [Choanephora cucurbitarum]